MNWGVMVCPPGAVRVLPTKTHNKRQAPPPATRGLMTLGKRACGGVWWAALLLGKQKKSKKTPVLGCRALIKPKRKERGGGTYKTGKPPRCWWWIKSRVFAAALQSEGKFANGGGGRGQEAVAIFSKGPSHPFLYSLWPSHHAFFPSGQSHPCTQKTLKTHRADAHAQLFLTLLTNSRVVGTTQKSWRFSHALAQTLSLARSLAIQVDGGVVWFSPTKKC